MKVVDQCNGQYMILCHQGEIDIINIGLIVIAQPNNEVEIIFEEDEKDIHQQMLAEISQHSSNPEFGK